MHGKYACNSCITSSLVRTPPVVHMKDLVVMWGLHFSLVPLNSSCEHLSTQLDSHKELVKILVSVGGKAHF